VSRSRVAGLLLVSLLCSCSSTPAPPTSKAPASGVGTPDWIVERFMDPKGFPKRADYYTGEMLEHFRTERTLGQFTPPEVSRTYRTLQSDSQLTVIGVHLRAPTGATSDYYLHMRPDSGQWKLEAVRTLSLMGVPTAVLESLTHKPALPESLRAVRDNLRLLLSSDESLVTYAKAHLSELKDLRTRFGSIKGVQQISTHSNPSRSAEAEVKRILSELCLDSIETHEKEEGLVFAVIGGMVDNTAGFVWVPPSAEPPSMDSSSYIVVIPVAEGWYLYKTT